MVTEEKVRKVLGEVKDPHLGISVVDMGLIYGIEVKDDQVKIEMTLTTPGCPMATAIVSEVENAVARMEEVERVEVRLVWDPPWTPEMMKKGIREPGEETSKE